MIETIIIILGFVWALYGSFQHGMVFEKIAIKLEKHLPEWLHNPVFDCPFCMCPWYGTLLSFLILDVDLIHAIFCSICAAGLSYIIVTHLNRHD